VRVGIGAFGAIRVSAGANRAGGDAGGRMKGSVPRDPVGDRKPGLLISWVRYPYDHHEYVLEISLRLRPHRTPGAAQLENDEHAGLNLHGSPV
jgi:hypothetical protein